MEWTREQKLKALMKLPWTVITERNERDGYLVARIAELPSVIATGETEKALARDLWASLYSSVSAYLQFDDDIPLPAGSALPWLGKAPPAPRQRVFAVLRGASWEATSGSRASSSAESTAVLALGS
jgi:hypothetical protein